MRSQISASMRAPIFKPLSLGVSSIWAFSKVAFWGCQVQGGALAALRPGAGSQFSLLDVMRVAALGASAITALCFTQARGQHCDPVAVVAAFAVVYWLGVVATDPLRSRDDTAGHYRWSTFEHQSSSFSRVVKLGASDWRRSVAPPGSKGLLHSASCAATCIEILPPCTVTEVPNLSVA